MTSNQITALTIYKEPKQKKQVLLKLKNKVAAVLLEFLNRRKKCIFGFSAVFVVSLLFFGSYLSTYPNLYSFVYIVFDYFFVQKIFPLVILIAFIFGFTIFGKYVVSICTTLTALFFGMFASVFLEFDALEDLYLIFVTLFCVLIFIIFYSDAFYLSKIACTNGKVMKISTGLYFSLRFVVALSLIDFLIFLMQNLVC